jgi:hypothetical protein
MQSASPQSPRVVFSNPWSKNADNKRNRKTPKENPKGRVQNPNRSRKHLLIY